MPRGPRVPASERSAARRPRGRDRNPQPRFPPGSAEPGRGLGRGPHALSRTGPGGLRRAAPSARPVQPRGRRRPHLPRAPQQQQRCRAASPTWRLARVTAPPTPRAFLGTLAGEDPAVRPPPPPPPPGRSSGRPQRTCCAACHGRWAPPAPPQPHNNMAAAASAGSRGAGRRATGGQ